MEKYTIDGTAKTPTINFDLQNGTIEIKGWSIPDNSIQFYDPFMQALEKYSGNAKPKTELAIELEYFNTSSSKCILAILKKLEGIKRAGNDVVVKWHYKKDDEDMLQAGEDYHTAVNIPFKMVEIDA